MSIPNYPEFAALGLEFKDETRTALSMAPDGVSEFSFAGLYLFRSRYEYQVSRIEDGALVLSGIEPAHNLGEERRTFFMTPCAAPGREVLGELFKTHHYWKNIPDSILLSNEARFREWGVETSEDRDNFDYLYLRADLAELPGKKYHKKRNLVAQFEKWYTAEEKPLSPENVPDALEVLEQWKRDKGEAGDFKAAQEALEFFAALDMEGRVYYIDGKPVAWCLGESVAQGRIFTVHFEKALDEYKGIYQFVNKSFAASLSESFTHINREQDLGDEGLRQAKMTYRPSSFVRKHKGTWNGTDAGL